ncbi:MAG: phenylacetate--CoA ligase family protein [Kiritimatiellae bacterium]|nr:phenylacetate--CoA ligase family protein [Kiritimatiellia bacterium]
MITDFNLRTFFHPWRIARHRRFLARAERFTPERLRAWQDERLRALVRYAYEQVPYYRDLFDREGLKPGDIRGAPDLVRIPPLTKELVRERAADLRSREFARLGPVPVRTSGSTGTPLTFYADRGLAAAKFATFWRVWNWAGYRLGQRWALIAGPVFDDGVLFRRVRAMNALYVSSFNLTAQTARQILDELLRFRPVFLRGYPSALYEFSRFIDDPAALRRIGIRSISTNSENLLPYQREQIETSFGCRVFDVYSQWEQVCVIAQCGRGAYHHQAEYGLLELLDAEGRPVAPGETGELTGTSLFHRAMPLIRYRTRDLARIGPTPCPCGRAHTVVEAIDGRLEDVVVTPDGRRVGRLDAAFKFNRGFDFAQVVQDAPDGLVVRLVRNPSFRPEIVAEVERHLRDRVGPALKIRFEFPDRIAPDANGKIRFVVNKQLHSRASEQ